MWGAQYNQQQPPPGGPPLQPGMPPPQGGSWNNSPQHSHQSGYGNNGDDYDQHGSALNSAVDMVASAASNIFAYGSRQQQPPPAMNNPQNIPGQGPPGPLGSAHQQQHHQPPQPIQPTSSLLSTPVQQPPPIQVDSSLLSARGAPGGPPMGMPPTQPTAAIGPPMSAASGPPMSAASGPPMSAASGPPMSAASGPPRVTPHPEPPKMTIASSIPPKMSTFSSTAPPANATMNTPTTAGSAASSPGASFLSTPKQTGKPIASLSPRTTKKLPLPPPSATLERRKRAPTKKFKLPPTYKSTTPTSTPISTKEKVSVIADKDTITPRTPQHPASATDASGAPSMPSTPTTQPAVSDATPKLSNVGPSPKATPQQQQSPVAGPAPAPVPTPAASLAIPSLASASEPPKKLPPEKAAPSTVPDTPLRSERDESEPTKPHALPPGWAELVHESTGKTYYWNEQDGTTSWERPVAPSENASVPAEAKSADTSAEVVAPPIHAAVSASSDADQQPESTTEASNQLPEGWIEAVDEASGSTYYVNTVDNTTSWSRPTMSELAMDTPMKQPSQPEQAPEENEEEEVQPVLQSESATASAPLPPGWEELQDEASGRSYFVNIATNETTWERPARPAVDSDEKPEAVGDENEVEPLAENAEPRTEETHGTPELTQENSNGSTEDDMFASSTAADTTMAILQDLQESESPLPPGWTEGFDPDSGRKFYVNEADQTTTWERPLAPVDQPVADLDMQEGNLTAGTEPSQSAPEVAGEKEEVIPAPELTDSVENDHQDSVEEIENKAKLPPGWVEATDPASGRPYFFNAETSETSWVPPAFVPEEPLDQDTDEDEEFVMVDSQQGEEGIAPELTHELMKARAPFSEGENSASNASSGENEDAAALAPGWKEFTETSTGRPYYINEAQNRRVWEKPLLETASVLSSAPDVSGFDGTDTVSELARDVIEEVAGEEDVGANERDTQTVAVGCESNGTAALPPGWEEDFDSLTQQIYYYHTPSGKSSWERPIESSESMPQQEPPARHTTMDELITPAGEANSAAVGETDNRPAESTDGTARINEETDETNSKENQVTNNNESDLAPGYVEKTDPLSGRVFYLNTDDDTSSWEKPVAKHDKSSDQSLPEKSANEEPAGTDTDAPELTNGEVGATAPEYNQVSDGAAKDEGEVDLPGEYNQVSDGAAKDEGEDDLPPGWVAVDDPSTGSKFYFNEAEQRTSWDKPLSLLQPNSQPEDVDSTTAEAIKSPEDQNGLPPGWVELFDESSGRPYFMNESTSETTWERPSMQNEQENVATSATEEAEPATGDNVTVAAREEIAMASEHSASEAQVDHSEESTLDANPEVPHPVDSALLPPGWVELFDEASGRPYFMNESTVETTWERPSVQYEQENVATSSPEESDLATGDNVTAEEEIAMASEHSTSEARLDHPDESTLDASLGVPPSADSALLPPGWVELFDESSGRPYFMNESTDETTWERPSMQNEQGIIPAGSTEVEVDIPPVESEAADETLLSSKTVPRAPSGGPPENPLPEEGTSELPPGWIEQVDPISGSTYYFNEIDNNSSWTKPEPLGIEDDGFATQDAEPTISSAAEPTEEIGEEAPAEIFDDQQESSRSDEMTRSSDLPEGWMEAFDESSGNIYYVNQVTNETAWERPTILAETQEASEHEITATSSTELPQPNVSNEEHLEHQEPSPVDAVEPSAETASPEELELPPGWAKELDQATGMIYYFNEAEKRTSWDPPTSEGLIPEAATTNTIDAEATETDETAPLAEALAPEGEELALPPSEDDRLPEGWVELTDESTGNTYFLNEASNETSWERPSLASGEEVFHEQSDPLIDSDFLLPEGWEEVVDENGATYYFNRIENKTQWDRPVGPTATAPEVDNTNGMGRNAENLQANRSRARPGHAFASFGFGGKLCVWRFTGRPENIKPVEIFRVSNIAPTHDLVQAETSKQQCGVLGPLDVALSQDVKSYMKERIERNPEDLLWRLLRIVTISKGKLRTTAGTANPRSPESALVALLLEEGSKISSEAQNDETDVGFIPGPVESIEEEHNGKWKHSEKAKFDTIQDLVLKGDRDAAIEFAIESNKFDLALLIGSCCGGDAFQRVVKQYAEKVLRRGSPLYTVAMLFSRQNLDSSMWSKCSNELLSSWPYNLSAIISNKIPGWESVAFELGKRLQQLGDIPSAHFCHVVAGLQLSSPTMPHTYMTLLGCDHLNPEAMSLMTAEGIEAFQRTEAYEWAKRRGNKKAIVKTIQPFKLYYAMLLADFGYLDLAGKYVESILKIFGLEEDSSRFDTFVSARATVPEMCESFEDFKATLVDFEQRLFRTVPEVTPATDTKRPATLPIAEETAPQFIAASPQEDTMHDMMMSPAESTEADQTFMTAVEPPSSEPKTKEALSRVTRKKASAEMGGPFGHSKPEARPTGPQSGPASTHVASAPPSEYGSPVPTTANLPPTTTAPGKEEAASKSVPAKKKPDPAPKSAPAVMSQSKKGGWLAGLRETITKKLNPDATTADVGETMQAYYDEDKKVWVFPGEDPAEVAKPLPPPPTPMEMSQKQAEVPKAPDMANDPLAAMMAPPNRTPATLSRSRAAAGGGVPPTTPRSLYPGMPPGSAAALGATPGAIPSTPQFMVFQPKPATEKIAEEKEDEPLPPTEE